ncbi:hypothetical protein [Rhodanobacter sp. C03]|uniref:hypothetical protein n=1 Tax=Rhodanobacter sp. C03 TaxID=1945858 RepID=UPI0011156437|nr:hypothetical protein [Rhodanobacter sp. C03]
MLNKYEGKLRRLTSYIHDARVMTRRQANWATMGGDSDCQQGAVSSDKPEIRHLLRCFLQTLLLNGNVHDGYSGGVAQADVMNFRHAK